MNKTMHELLQREEYGFIHSDKNLGDNMIYLTFSGSIGYGTNTENSDIDVRGVTIERKENIYGFSEFEQFEELETDTVIFGLKKFTALALKGNPNILELLGTQDEHIVFMNQYGAQLRENSQLFLSKRVINTFGNYATAQLRRLQNALARDHYPEVEKEKHILNTLNSQMHHFEANYTGFPNGGIKLYIGKSDKPDKEAEIFLDAHLEHYPLRDFASIYSEMNNIVRDYDKLNHRNRKKDNQKLYKHAMHLIRLLLMGTEILDKQQLHTYRSKEHDMLMDIRNGKLSFEELFELVEACELKFQQAAQSTTLPEVPDEEQVQQLLISIYEDFYYHKNKS